MYATVYDVEKRCKRKLSIDEIEWCESLLQDAAIIVDTYGKMHQKRQHSSYLAIWWCVQYAVEMMKTYQLERPREPYQDLDILRHGALEVDLQENFI